MTVSPVVLKTGAMPSMVTERLSSTGLMDLSSVCIESVMALTAGCKLFTSRSSMVLTMLEQESIIAAALEMGVPVLSILSCDCSCSVRRMSPSSVERTYVVAEVSGRASLSAVSWSCSFPAASSASSSIASHFSPASMSFLFSARRFNAVDSSSSCLFISVSLPSSPFSSTFRALAAESMLCCTCETPAWPFSTKLPTVPAVSPTPFKRLSIFSLFAVKLSMAVPA